MFKLSQYLKKKLVIKLKINDIKPINDRYIVENISKEWKMPRGNKRFINGKIKWRTLK